MKTTDPAIQRTRDARKRISAEFGNDPSKLIAYYLKTQKRFGTRLRHAPPEHRSAGLVEQSDALDRQG